MISSNLWIIFCTIFKKLNNELRNDKDIVLTAVQKDGMALQYAPKRLKNDNDLSQVRSYQDILKVSPRRPQAIAQLPNHHRTRATTTPTPYQET